MKKMFRPTCINGALKGNNENLFSWKKSKLEENRRIFGGLEWRWNI